MKGGLKDFAWAIAPGTMANRAVRWNASVERRSGWEEVERVDAGPVAGLVYPAEVRKWISAPTLKRTGTYEAELAEHLPELLSGATAFVNVGASDGYYLIGVARWGVPSIGYESSPIHQRNLRLIAAANHVSVEVRGHCRVLPELAPGTVLLIDVEGNEDDLLDRPDAVAKVAGSTVIVEVHDWMRPGVTDRLVRRFGTTHEHRLIEGRLEPRRQAAARWLVLTPRRGSAPSSDGRRTPPASGKRRTRALPVLLYHGVGPLSPEASVGLTVTPDVFAAHLGWLIRHRYTTVTAEQCVEFIRGEQMLPERSIMLTFDDAYRNLCEHALPLIVEHGMNATIFVVTGQIGGRAAWDESVGLPAAPLMSAEDITEWDKQAGITFGAQTRTHPDLSRLDDDAVEEEVGGSRRDLEGLLQHPVRAFAYPFGATSPAAHASASRHFDLAFTVVEELNAPGRDPHLLGRTNLLSSDHALDLQLAVQLGFSPRVRVRKWLGRQRRRVFPSHRV